MTEATARFLLAATLLLPAAGTILVGGSRERARQSALISALLTLVLAALLVAFFPGGTEPFALIDANWFGQTELPIDVRFAVGLDGLNIWLFGLTALLMVTAVLISWESITHQTTAFYRLLLLLETGMLGVFVARDIILFYVFFEFTLIPLFLLIGMWGSEDRRYAAMKFFLFTLAGSVLTLLGLLSIVLWVYRDSGVLTFSIPTLTAYLGALAGPERMSTAVQVWIFVALFAGFAIKVPLFPLHTWLPLAHVQAPAAGSVILAGVLLKIGTYGFLRFNVAMLPEATAACMPWLLWLSVAGILYGALVALAQSDIKRLVAYSSVSHLGFCMLGIFALNRLGTQGGVLQMINHGLSTGALFALVGMLYERYHTRQIKDLGGLARQTPVLAFFMLLMTLSSIGLPGLNGFAGELLILIGMFQRGWADAPAAWADQYRVIAVLATSGVVLGAWYMLWLVQRVFFGPVREPHQEPGHEPVRDLCGREIAALVPIAVFCVWIGVHPGYFLEKMEPSLNQMTALAERVVDGEEPELGVEGSGFGVQDGNAILHKAATSGRALTTPKTQPSTQSPTNTRTPTGTPRLVTNTSPAATEN